MNTHINEANLSEAIGNGEIVVYYQPRIRLVGTQAGGIHGFEALVRWEHPQLGTLRPLDFIPQAVEFGLISRLTECVLDQALARIAVWRSGGADYQVSVNLFPSILGDNKLIDFLSRTLSGYGVPAPSLTIDITETCFTDDVPSNLANLVRMRARGITLAMDDFGTGTTSLIQIHTRPFAEVKIDQSIITRLDNLHEAKRAVGKMIPLIQQLGLRACAVGIETRQGYEFLQQLGCDLGQGYFMSPPLPADQVSAWVGKWSAGPRA